MKFLQDRNFTNLFAEHLSEDFVRTITDFSEALSHPVGKDCWGTAKLQSYLDCTMLIPSGHGNDTVSEHKFPYDVTFYTKNR